MGLIQLVNVSPFSVNSEGNVMIMPLCVQAQARYTPCNGSVSVYLRCYSCSMINEVEVRTSSHVFLDFGFCFVIKLNLVLLT